jgi:hypothetical protein
MTVAEPAIYYLEIVTVDIEAARRLPIEAMCCPA